MQEPQVQFPDWENALEKETATPLQYFFLGKPMDRGAYRATVYWGCKRVRHDLVAKQQSFYQSAWHVADILYLSVPLFTWMNAGTGQVNGVSPDISGDVEQKTWQ